MAVLFNASLYVGFVKAQGCHTPHPLNGSGGFLSCVSSFWIFHGTPNVTILAGNLENCSAAKHGALVEGVGNFTPYASLGSVQSQCSSSSPCTTMEAVWWPFEALSFAWEDPRDCVMKIGPKNTSGSFPICTLGPTANLTNGTRDPNTTATVVNTSQRITVRTPYRRIVDPGLA